MFDARLPQCLKLARENNKIQTAGSDIHVIEQVGLAGMIVPDYISNQFELRDYIKSYEPVIYDKNGVKRETLISYDDTPCFGVGRISINASSTNDFIAPAIYIVTEGSGTISCGGKTEEIKKGDYFFAPHNIKGNFTVATNSSLELVECLPAKE